MRSRWLFFMLILACSLGQRIAQAESQLTIMADDRRPLSWQENGVPRGICYELVAETMKELQQVRPIEITSFNRGLRLTMFGQNMAFFSVLPTPERSQSLKWAGPLLSSDVYIYKLKDSVRPIRSLEDLRKLEGIGVPLGMQQSDFLLRLGVKAVPFDSVPKTLLGLKNGRVEAIAIASLVLRDAALEAKLDPNMFEQTPVFLYRAPLYIAFSNDISDETVQRWQKALDAVKNKHYSRLHKKYLENSPLSDKK